MGSLIAIGTSKNPFPIVFLFIKLDLQRYKFQ
jgi:hypothetical protein